MGATMFQPMTPIELLASAGALIATGAMFWWAAQHIIRLAVALYHRCAPMRKDSNG